MKKNRPINRIPEPKPEFVPSDPSQSLFKLVDRFWGDQNNSSAFHRICNLVRLMGVQTTVVESLRHGSGGHTALQDEYRAIKARLKNAAVELQAYKLTFISKVLNNQATPLDAENHLGYVTIVTIKVGTLPSHSYILESVIREYYRDNAVRPQMECPTPWAPFLHVKRRFQCTMYSGSHKYNIIGTFFCQQNTITSVCAHACTAMLINNGRSATSTVTCQNINEHLGIDQIHRMQQIPEAYGDNSYSTHIGLYPRETARVLREYGLRPYLLSVSENKRRNYREFLYGFIESGYPGLLVFKNQTSNGDESAHVVAVVGHSLNSHSWFPTAYVSYVQPVRKDKPYLSTLNWVDDFIVHDDNFGMQLYLPAHTFRPEDHPDPGSAFMPIQAIGIFPIEPTISILGHQAERIAWDVLQAVFDDTVGTKPILENYYVNRLSKHILGNHNHPPTAVIRTLLISVENYLAHLGSADRLGRKYSDAAIQYVTQQLSSLSHVWLSEVTEPDLYVANCTKVVDVLIDPQYNPDEFELVKNEQASPIRLIRFPEHLAAVASYKNGRPEVEVWPIDGIPGHMPLFRLPVL